MEDRLVQIKSAMGTQSWNDTCRTNRTFYSDTQVKIHNQWDAMSAEDRKKYQDMASQAVEQVNPNATSGKVHLLDPVVSTLILSYQGHVKPGVFILHFF